MTVGSPIDPPTFLAELRRGLRELSNLSQGEAMQAYMKSEMPFLGVKTPDRRGVTKEIFSTYRLQTFEDWRDAAQSLWREAEYREERYVAIDLLAHRYYKAFRSLDALPLYEEIIVTGAWWDLVDPIASHRLGELLTKEAVTMTKVLKEWSRDADLWKRRSSILSQIRLKAAVDFDLLYFCIDGSISDPAFFARKAIGWALREHGKTYPDEIRRYVVAQEHRLSPLSRKEALKNLSP